MSIKQRVEYYTNNLTCTNIEFRKENILDNNKQSLHNKIQGITFGNLEKMLTFMV